MKHIVHIGFGGGVTTMMRDLSTAMPGVGFTTLSFGPTSLLAAVSPTSFVWQGQFRLDKYLVNILRTYRWLRTSQPDLVVLHGLIPMALLSLPAQWAGVKKIVGLDVGPQPTYWRVKKIFFWFSRYAISHVMSVSEESAAWFRRYYPWFRHRVEVINNGVDIPEHKPQRTRLHNPPYVITTLSRIEGPQKDPMTLFKAGLLLHKRNIPIDLRFVGDGDLLPALKKNILDSAAQGFIHCLGHRADYQSLLEETDIFVLSTNWEGLSLGLLEAMGNGIPVIATRVVGNTGVIIDGQTGRLFEPGDAQELADIIIEFITHPIATRELATRAVLEVRKKYLRSRMVTEYQEWFTELLKQ